MAKATYWAAIVVAVSGPVTRLDKYRSWPGLVSGCCFCEHSYAACLH